MLLEGGRKVKCENIHFLMWNDINDSMYKTGQEEEEEERQETQANYTYTHTPHSLPNWPQIIVMKLYLLPTPSKHTVMDTLHLLAV